MLQEEKIKNLESLSKKIRKETLEMIYRTKSPHLGSSFSVVELLVALYFHSLKNEPGFSTDKNRDRFILSKGHAAPAFYATLASRGFLKEEDLAGFAVNEGKLAQHPNYDLSLGIEFSTGSLGHGLSVGTGMALALKHDQLESRVFVLLGDGELDEGTNWEAMMFASQYKLDNLVAIVDYNKFQILGSIAEIMNLEPLADKWQSFGWGVQEINGHNFGEIIESLDNLPPEKEKPTVIIAHTIKGKGVSFMENDNIWHSKWPNEEEYNRALLELE